MLYQISCKHKKIHTVIYAWVTLIAKFYNSICFFLFFFVFVFDYVLIILKKNRNSNFKEKHIQNKKSEKQRHKKKKKLNDVCIFIACIFLSFPFCCANCCDPFVFSLFCLCLGLCGVVCLFCFLFCFCLLVLQLNSF